MAQDPHDVLGVEHGADLAQIRRAYLAHLRASHPDLRPHDADAERRTRELNRAWDQLRARHAGHNGRSPLPSAPRPRPPTAAYSPQQRAFRTAFTAATLRLALGLLAVGLLMLLLALGH